MQDVMFSSDPGAQGSLLLWKDRSREEGTQRAVQAAITNIGRLRDIVVQIRGAEVTVHVASMVCIQASTETLVLCRRFAQCAVRTVEQCLNRKGPKLALLRCHDLQRQLDVTVRSLEALKQTPAMKRNKMPLETDLPNEDTDLGTVLQQLRKKKKKCKEDCSLFLQRFKKESEIFRQKRTIRRL